MTVPYTFANQSGPVPASELDANFAAVGNNVATANTVLAHAQPNITSVGILTAVSTSGNIVATGDLTANNITINTIVEPVITNDLDVTGQVFVDWLDANAAPLPGAGIVASTANIYDIGESSSPFANVYATRYYGDASNLTGIIGNAVLAQAVLNNSQPNITTVGTLSYLSSTGNITGGNLLTTGILSVGGNVIIAGNLSVTGNTITVNTEIVNVTESITGNVTAGNILTGGLISATGNVTGGNVTAGSLFYTTGNVQAIGAVNTPNVVITKSFIFNGLYGNATIDNSANFSTTGNVTGNNLYTAGVISATGNIRGGNINTSGNVNTGNVVFALNGSKFNSAAWTLVESFANLNFTASSTVRVTMTNSIGYYKTNYNELVVTYYGTPFGPGGQIQTTLPTPAISVPGLFVIGTAGGAGGAPFTIQWSNINSGNTSITSGTGGDTAYVGIYAR